MRLDFVKNYGHKIICYLLLSALITFSAVGLLMLLLGRLERCLRAEGYRSVVFGPDGMRPEYRVMCLILIGLITFVICFYLMIRSSLKYLHLLIVKVQEISEGDFDNPVEVRGNDEFAAMAGNLNRMQRKVKKLMESERKAEHTKNDLVSSVAHDIRTPLTSILGYLGWIRERRDLDGETREKYIEIVYDKAKRLEQLTNELFGFVKLEHNELQLRTGRLDLVQLMEQMLDEMTPSFVKYELDVKFYHARPSLVVEADGELLARLFGNLLNNAVKYGREGKEIIVRMEVSEEWVVTKVINFGHVIPKEELDAIFQKFYRSEQSRSRNTGGTGLGLAIVQQIAALHHGEVHVKSDLQGTAFEVDLPLRQPAGKDEEKDEN